MKLLYGIVKINEKGETISPSFACFNDEKFAKEALDTYYQDDLGIQFVEFYDSIDDFKIRNKIVDA
ncbi:hypothetical protein HYS94_01920 [Candidatus Daviesbacteria bacterium]|nr:hypothetical protein [Candidatus Daviesbacteria bacterium]